MGKYSKFYCLVSTACFASTWLDSLGTRYFSLRHFPRQIVPHLCRQDSQLRAVVTLHENEIIFNTTLTESFHSSQTEECLKFVKFYGLPFSKTCVERMKKCLPVFLFDVLFDFKWMAFMICNSYCLLPAINIISKLIKTWRQDRSKQKM